jgi:hypothetical protein
MDLLSEVIHSHVGRGHHQDLPYALLGEVVDDGGGGHGFARAGGTCFVCVCVCGCEMEVKEEDEQ